MDEPSCDEGLGVLKLLGRYWRAIDQANCCIKCTARSNSACTDELKVVVVVVVDVEIGGKKGDLELLFFKIF